MVVEIMRLYVNFFCPRNENSLGGSHKIRIRWKRRLLCRHIMFKIVISLIDFYSKLIGISELDKIFKHHFGISSHF